VCSAPYSGKANFTRLALRENPKKTANLMKITKKESRKKIASDIKTKTTIFIPKTKQL
jgi:hypothetical protein